MPKGAFHFPQHHWVKIRYWHIGPKINTQGNYNGKNHHKTKVILKLFILKDALHLSGQCKIAEYKIAPCQKHEQNNDVLNQRLIVPKGQARIFGGKPSR